jgi:hypothetical protein
VEVTHVAGSLLGRRPLERVEEPVVLERGAAVQRVLRAGRELGGGRVEVEPGATLPQLGEGRQPVLAEQAVEQAGAGGVELEDGEHQRPCA